MAVAPFIIGLSPLPDFLIGGSFSLSASVEGVRCAAPRRADAASLCGLTPPPADCGASVKAGPAFSFTRRCVGANDNGPRDHAYWLKLISEFDAASRQASSVLRRVRRRLCVVYSLRHLPQSGDVRCKSLRGLKHKTFAENGA